MKIINIIYFAIFVYACMISYLYFSKNNITTTDNKIIEKNILSYNDSLKTERSRNDSLNNLITNQLNKIDNSKKSIQVIVAKNEKNKKSILLLDADSSLSLLSKNIATEINNRN